MATVITNGKQTVKLYHSVNRGKAMYQLAFYTAGKRIQKNFSDKSEAKRMAKRILSGLTDDEETIDALANASLKICRNEAIENAERMSPTEAVSRKITVIVFRPKYKSDTLRSRT
jgi:hypothetical protein